jgi:hypothetical protein
LPIPGLVEFCIDWTNKRAHFRFDGQGKRCMRFESEVNDLGCWISRWLEAPCNWF